MSKIVLEINYKTVFETEEEYIKHLTRNKEQAPRVYEQTLRAEYSKKPEKHVYEINENMRTTRTINVSRIGLA